MTEVLPVEIPAGSVTLPGDLRPGGLARPTGLVIFAHGSGSSRRSPRNVAVAEDLVQLGLSSLLFDLLTREEEALDRAEARLRFDIARLADRLIAVVDWCATQGSLRGLPIGLFGASTGAAAALTAAAERPAAVRAVVSRGGRPDLAGDALARVRAPTLLVVGSADEVVLDLNRQAAARLRAVHELAVVPGAGHLFEEPGTLAQVAGQAGQWFRSYFGGGLNRAAAHAERQA